MTLSAIAPGTEVTWLDYLRLDEQPLPEVKALFGELASGFYLANLDPQPYVVGPFQQLDDAVSYWTTTGVHGGEFIVNHQQATFPVWVVSWAPLDGRAATGGIEWRYLRQDAVAYLAGEVAKPENDVFIHMFRRVEVPAKPGEANPGLGGMAQQERITRYLDEIIDGCTWPQAVPA